MIPDIQPGSASKPFGNKAKQYNEMTRVVNHFTEHGLPETDSVEDGLPGTVLAYPEDSETEYAEYEVVAIQKNHSEPEAEDGVLDPACGFAKSIQYVIEDIDTSKEQILAIVQRLLMAGKGYEVMLFGLTRVLIDIIDTEHKYATLKSEQPEDGTSAQLKSAAAGEFEIITIPRDPDSGDPLDGEQWCTVRFPVGGESGAYDNPYDLKWTEPTEEPYLLECDYQDKLYTSELDGEDNTETIYNFADIPTEQEEAEEPEAGVILQQAIDFRIDESDGFQKLVCNFHYDSSGKLLAITDPEWKTFAMVKTCYFPTPAV